MFFNTNLFVAFTLIVFCLIFPYLKTPHPSAIKSKELKNKILSFGSKLKVIEPASFRDEIRDEINKLNRKYSR